MLKARLAHVGLNCKEPKVLADFYGEMFGLGLVGGSKSGSNTFVASHPEDENHDLAFFRNNPEAAHVGLRVETPEELLEVYRRVKERNIHIEYFFNHGFALAIYFTDPEGNMIETYWPTGREDYQPPYVERLVLEGRTADDLRQLVAAMPGPKDVSTA